MVSPIVSHSTNPEDSEKVVCRLCHRQFGKYTCPKCNVPYCSLICFRSEAHSQCSEPFYKSELESGIRGESSTTAEERAQMLSLLKRFEEESAENDEDPDDDETELERRLASVDLDSVASDALWALLTQADKDKFLKTVNDPSSDLAQQLLSREELYDQLSEPWWNSLPVVSDPDHESYSKYPPSRMEVPEALLKPPANRPLLVYNLSAISIAYAFVIRHLGITSLYAMSMDDPDRGAAYELLTQLLPFFVDRKSTVVFSNLDSVITDLASRLKLDEGFSGFVTLLRDAYQLMCPLKITQVSASPSSSPKFVDLCSHPHQLPLFLLSDLSRFFSSGLDQHRLPQSSRHLPYKLCFYAAHVITMPTPLLRGIAHELEQKSNALQAHLKAPNQSKADDAMIKLEGPSQSRSRIEDLSDEAGAKGDA